MSTLLADAMAEYMERVLPAEASKDQVIETRRAFYAGAQTMMRIWIEVPDDDKVVDAMFKGITQEFQEFLDKVKQGEA